ncbi:MAG: CPBP family intramembrane metalloprotease [Bacteroidales bacterium]|nr:CPBP family intramembrane metalloprotease [Bacteroidales bacterium]
MFRRYWTYIPDFRESWILVAIMIIGGSLLSWAVTYILQLALPTLSDWHPVVAYPFIFLPPYLWIRQVNKRHPSAAKIPFNSPDFGSLGGLVTFLLLPPLLIAFNYVTEPLSSWMPVPDFIRDLLESVTKNKYSSLLMMVIFAPLFEETFCRGIILRGLLCHMKPWKAILWSALIFGVIHLNPWQAIPAFLVGSLMGWIYWKTGSLWATIFLHFVNNGFSYIIVLLNPNMSADAGFKDLIPGNGYYFFYALSLLFLIITTFIMKYKYGNTLPTKIQTNN